MSIKSRIAWLLLVCVSALFAFKYLPRYSEYGNIIASVIVLVQLIPLWRPDPGGRLLNRRVVYLAAIAVLVVACFIAWRYIDIQELQVDRWSVIDAFLIELSEGRYPYMGQSHLGNYPGPMPMYFVIALPFYLLGDLSLLSVSGYIGAVIYTLYNRGKLNRPALVVCLLVSSFYIYWEIFVRSNVFTYSALVLAGLYAFDRIPDLNKARQIFVSVMTGLLLSTRSVFVLAYLIFFLVPLRTREIAVRKWVSLTFIAAASFVITFIPLVVFFPEQFQQVNPFVIQSAIMIPGQLVTVFLALAVLVSLVIPNTVDKYFYSGVVLFASILLYALYHIEDVGFQVAFYGNIIDISYFVFAVPFLMFFLVRDHQVGREYQPAEVQLSA